MASENREIIQTNGLSASDLCLADSWNIVECKTDDRLVHWEAARVAIAKLKSQGFFCIIPKLDFISKEKNAHFIRPYRRHMSNFSTR